MSTGARIALIVVGVLTGLVALGAVALVGIFLVIGEAQTDEIENARANDAVNRGSGGPDRPVDITPGRPFELSGVGYTGDWVVEARGEDPGWRVRGLQVTNGTGTYGQVLVDVRLWEGDEQVGLVECLTKLLQVDESDELFCETHEDLPAYDRVTINDPA